MNKIFETLLEELAPTALNLLNKALVELAAKDPVDAQKEILEMARQSGIAAVARKGYKRTP